MRFAVRSMQSSARGGWKHYALIAAACVSLCGPAIASQLSARDLRNGVHFYQVRNFPKSKRYFLSVLSIGTAQEKSIAREYLARPVFRRIHVKEAEDETSRQAPSLESDAVLGGGENAPERQRTRQTAESPVHFSGYLAEQLGARTREPTQLSQLRTVGYAAGTGSMTDWLTFKVSGRLWYDGVYDWTSHYPRSVEDDQKTDGELRDTYLDASLGSWDVRLGKQQIVWGEALGLFYADVVNAKDLREFVLPDFDFIRTPEWGTDVEYTVDDFHVEGLWLPWPMMDRVGRPGSEYAFFVPTLPGVKTTFGGETTPDRSIENGEWGGRLSERAGGWDVSAFALRTWDKTPVYIPEPSLDGLTLQATHPRLTVAGFTGAKEFADVVYKTEFIYNWKKYFQSTDPANVSGVSAKNYADYLISADHTFGSHWDTSLQLSQRYINDYQSDLFQQKEWRTLVTAWAKRGFFDDKLAPQLMLIDDLTSGDVMVRPSVAAKFASHWRWIVEYDFFSGPPDGLFGEFTDRDRIFTEIRYDF